MLERGKSDAAVQDAEVLQLATAEKRCVITLNRRDFIRLHHERPDHAGIIVCTVDADFIGQAQRIHAAIVTNPDLTGRLIRVNRPSG